MAETETAPAAAPATSAPPSDWRAALTGDYAPLQSEKSLEGFKGKDWTEVGPALAKSFVETKKLVGTKLEGMVRIPGADAKPEDVTSYRKALGVPDAPDGYQITRPEIAVDASLWDEQAEKAFLADAHKSGLAPAQVQDVLNWYGSWVASNVEKARQEMFAADESLRREWGPNYDAHLGRANRLISEVDHAIGAKGALDQYLQKSGLGRHPLFIRAWAHLADQMVEAGAIAPTGTLVSKDEAQAQMNAILSDKAHAFHNPNHPQYADAMEEFLRLRRVIDGADGGKPVMTV